MDNVRVKFLIGQEIQDKLTINVQRLPRGFAPDSLEVVLLYDGKEISSSEIDLSDFERK